MRYIYVYNGHTCVHTYDRIDGQPIAVEKLIKLSPLQTIYDSESGAI